jgi:uncharacterized membrane protein
MTENATSPLLLTVLYWMHMLATVIWIGGLAALALLVLPSARKRLDSTAYSILLTDMQHRLQGIGWFSLAVLGLTGMFQMSANPNYTGFLEINNPWASAILVKHLVIGLMVLVSGWMTWGLMPALRRTAMLRAAGRSVDESLEKKLQSRERLLLNLNLLLSVVVLLLTAWARSAN